MSSLQGPAYITSSSGYTEAQLVACSPKGKPGLFCTQTDPASYHSGTLSTPALVATCMDRRTSIFRPRSSTFRTDHTECVLIPLQSRA